MLSPTSTSTIDPWQRSSAVSAEPMANLTGVCALLAALVQSQSATESGAKTEVTLSFKKMEELKQELADAVQHAQEAAKHSGFLGFLGKVFGSDIAKIAGAVAALAAVVATGGAAAPLLLIAVSAALQVAAKVGEELGLDPKLCMAIGIASVAVGLCSGMGSTQAAGALANAARDVELGAKVVGSGSTMAGGALQGAAGYYHGKELHYQADAAGYHSAQDLTSLTLDDAFALLERALRVEHNETSTVSEMVQNDSDTQATLCNRI